MVVREGSERRPKAMFRMHETDGPTASPVFQAAVRLLRTLGFAQQLMREDNLYLHHTKVNLKPPSKALSGLGIRTTAPGPTTASAGPISSR